MDTNVVAVRPRQTLIHAADNHGVAQSGPPQPKFSPRITRMNAKKNFGSKSREPASPRKLSGLQRNPQYPCNRADGISEIEGKAARAAASELGSERVSTPWFSPLCFVSIRVHSWLTPFWEEEEATTRLRPAGAGLRRGKRITRMLGNAEARMTNDEGMTKHEERGPTNHPPSPATPKVFASTMDEIRCIV